MPPWANGKNGKEYRATLGQKAIAGIFSVGLEEKYRWKDSVQNGDEIRLWVADGIAQDLRPWFIKFNAKPIDQRWLPVVEEIYQWHYANERYLRNESRSPAWPWSTRSRRRVLWRPGGARQGRRSCTGLLSGAGRSPDPLRNGARSPCSTRSTSTATRP